MVLRSLRYAWIATSILLATVASAQVQVQVELVTPQVRYGQSARVRARLRNPWVSRQVDIKATATYTDAAGVQQTVQSNIVTLTVDATLPIRLEIPVPRLSLVPGTATLDGRAIQPTGNTGIVFDFDLLGDGLEHLLELDVMP